MVTVVKPRWPGQPISWAIRMKSISIEMPVMTSGMTSGAVTKPEKAVRPRKRRKRARARPAMVPRMVAKVALTKAICSERRAASITWSFWNRLGVPLGREAAPDGREARLVEGEDDHREDRHVEEGEAEDEAADQEGRAAGHRRRAPRGLAAAGRRCGHKERAGARIVSLSVFRLLRENEERTFASHARARPRRPRAGAPAPRCRSGARAARGGPRRPPSSSPATARYEAGGCPAAHGDARAEAGHGAWSPAERGLVAGVEHHRADEQDSSATETAEAIGQSRAWENSSLMTRPIIGSEASPTRRRDDQLARGRDEDQQAAGDDAGDRERQGDVAEHLPRARAEVGRGLVERRVEALEAGVERQHHERQVGVDEDQDRPRSSSTSAASSAAPSRPGRGRSRRRSGSRLNQLCEPISPIQA